MTKIGVQIELEGAPQYISNMSKLTSQTKLYQAQMNRLAQELSNTSAYQKSITMSKALGQQLEALQNKAKYLEQEIEKEASKSDELSSREIYLKTQYENLQAEIARTTKALKDQGGVAGAIGAQFEEVGQKLSSIGSKIADIGDTLTKKISVPIAGVAAGSVKAFADWESAFAGVMKTVDETATTTYNDISEGIKKMATETASSKEDIAAVAEAAGQLGVKADDVLKFTKTMVMLGDSTNLSSEEAATSLARIVNITGDSMQSIDQLGSAIVALGNNFATNESSIVEMSNRLASAGTIAGLSTTEIFALATAMSSVGIEAEAGGTAMTQTLTGISQAVSESGEKLSMLAQVAGTSADDFAKKWKSSPITALQEFINGLSDMNAKGEDTYKILDELGMSGIRQSNMLQSLALANDQLANAVKVSGDAYKANSALTDEASKRYETFASQLNQTKEMLTNVGIEIGSTLMPYIQQFLEKIQSLVEWFQSLDKQQQEFILKAALIAAAIGPILSSIGRISTGVGAISQIIGKLAPLVPTITGFVSSIGAVITGTLLPALGSIVAAITPFLPIIAAVAAAIAALIIVIKNWATITDFVSEKWNVLKEFLGNALAEITAYFNEHFGIIGQIFTTHINIIATLIKTTVEVIGTVIKAAGNVIRALFTGDWNTIGKIVSQAWNSIKTTVSNGVSNIINVITNMGNNVRNTFSNLLSSAWDWGSHFVQNFCDGITSKMSALIDKVRSMADTVRSYLHFSHPDIGPLKDANKWPRDFVQQYAQGIESARYLIQNAVGDVAADIAVLQNPIDSEEVYSAIRSGASDATIRLAIGDREFSRALRDMGVVFNG